MSASLTTLAEESGYRRTGRSDEVTRLCAAFAATWPGVVRELEFGRSAEGRAMRALLVSRADPGSVPLLLVQAGIHPGESDGKDAGFIALRELLEGRAAAGALARMAILFVPAFNVDGHERFGPLEPSQPARPRGVRLARDGAEPQSQPRLRQGGLTGDALAPRAHRRARPAGMR